MNYHGGNSLFIDGASMGFTINSTQVIDSAANSSPITYSAIQSVEFDLLGGSNTLTQQAQPAAAVTLNAGPGSNTLNVYGGAFTFNSDPAIGSGNLTVNDNAAVTFAAAPSGGRYAARNLGALNLGSSATATLIASTTATDRTVLETNSLSIAAGGTLNLTNNAMIIHNGSINNVASLIGSGYNAGNMPWTGTGITSSSAQTDSIHLTAIGAISNNNSGAAFFSTFDNQTATAADVLVKDTYVGDVNLDGKVDGSDYSRIDSAVLTGATGWFNGDFNYDGAVNGSDYTLMDNAFNTQSNQLPVHPPISNPAPVAYYNFNADTGSTVTDSTVDGYTGTSHGTAVVSGVDGTTAISYNGTSSYVSLPALDLNSNAITLSGWIKRNGSQTIGTGVIFDRTRTAGDGLTIGPDDRLAYSWGSSGATYNFNSNLVVPDGRWTFVALVVTASNATLYMQPQDGTLSSAINNAANAVQSFSTPTDVGQDPDGGKFFKGAIDEVRIYNSALTEPQIQSIANLAPAIVVAATSTPSAEISYQTALYVQATSQAGDANLIYNWSVISAPQNSQVTFSANGTASAYCTTATGTVAGAYLFQVTVTDPGHMSASSTVSETFDDEPYDIAEINYPPSPKGAGITSLQMGNFVVDSPTPDDFNFNDNAADRWVYIVNSLTVVGPESQLDIGNNDLIIHNNTAAAAAQTLAAITGYVDSGYGAGGASPWTYGGIVSSLAQEDELSRSAISVMSNMGSNGKAILSTFDGQAITSTDVLVNYVG